MNALIAVLTLAVCGGAMFLSPNEAPGALAFCIVTSLPTFLILARRTEDRTFLLRVFVLALLIRIAIATVIFGRYEDFFGGDANTYDIYGRSLNAAWHGDKYHLGRYQSFVASGASAWGMLYLVAGVYEVIGRNMFAIQLINASIGATTAIVIYDTADKLFSNRRVSRLTCLLVGFFPSLVLWSSQALKDGIIVLVLTLAIYCTLKLLEKVKIGYVLVLTACLLSLLTLRFYTFYMMAAAVGGSFIIGGKALDTQGFIRRFAAMIAIGLVFTYFGIVRYAGTQYDQFANLKMVENSRKDQAKSADSGFMKDVDVQTTEGALTAIPIGFVYLLFAPFPWQLASVRQSIALPEMIIWWFSFPLLVLGLWFALKHKLRQVAPIVIFTTMLTLAYSLVQGNVGTAYRQRSQLLVFYFIFVAVGGVIMKERSEDREREAERAKKELADLQAARALARRQGTQTAVGSQ
jgi:hypothetical protein